MQKPPICIAETTYLYCRNHNLLFLNRHSVIHKPESAVSKARDCPT